MEDIQLYSIVLDPVQGYANDGWYREHHDLAFCIQIINLDMIKKITYGPPEAGF